MADDGTVVRTGVGAAGVVGIDPSGEGVGGHGAPPQARLPATCNFFGGNRGGITHYAAGHGTGWITRYATAQPRVSTSCRKLAFDKRPRNLHETVVQRAVNNAASASGVTCYIFRHSFATHPLERRHKSRTVQDSSDIPTSGRPRSTLTSCGLATRVAQPSRHSLSRITRIGLPCRYPRYAAERARLAASEFKLGRHHAARSQQRSLLPIR